MHAVIRFSDDDPHRGEPGPAVVLDGAAAPALILAELERHAARTVTLPSALLWRLCRDPAAFMTDLSSVRAVYHRGPEPAPGDTALAEEVFGPVLVHVPADGPGLAELVQVASAAGDAAAGPVTAEQVAAYLTALTGAALDSMLATLQSHRVLDDPGRTWTATEVATAAAPERFHHVVDRWLRVLVEHGRVYRDQDTLRGTVPVPADRVEQNWQEVREAWTGVLGDATFVDYVATNAARLDELLSGREQAAALLFPRGETTIADAIYRGTVTARYLNAAVAAVVAARAATEPLRVLEVGAGTGATTDAVLAALGPHAVADYLFSDVSQFFLSAARARLGGRAGIRFGLFDVDRPEPIGEHDVIVAAGVLNNARDISAAVAALAGALGPGGLLLITEPVRDSLEILVSQIVMMTPPVDVRATDGTTFASLTRWTQTLTASGLDVAVLPDDGHVLAPLGQRLLIGVRR